MGPKKEIFCHGKRAGIQEDLPSWTVTEAVSHDATKMGL
jgi:hypothetical protein